MIMQEKSFLTCRRKKIVFRRYKLSLVKAVFFCLTEKPSSTPIFYTMEEKIMNKNSIIVTYGEDPRVMTEQLLAAVKPEEMIKPGATIGLKPNLVLGKPADGGATTHPEIAEGIIEYLLVKGFKKIIIMEGSWVGADTKRAFTTCGYKRLADKYHLELVDLKKDQTIKVEAGGDPLEICALAKEVDFLINLPVLKAHCQTGLTCALKNLKGCIPDREKRRFHRLGLHRPIACLNKAIRSHLTVVDSIVGDLTYEGGGTPVRMDRVIAGRDPVMVDAYAAELIGYRAAEVEYIGLAERLGVGNAAAGEDSIVYLNRRTAARRDEPALASGEVDYLRRWILEKEACSPCYAALIYALRRLKESGQLEKLPPVCIGQG